MPLRLADDKSFYRGLEPESPTDHHFGFVLLFFFAGQPCATLINGSLLVANEPAVTRRCAFAKRVRLGHCPVPQASAIQERVRVVPTAQSDRNA